jgi:hypothetical protein
MTAFKSLIFAGVTLAISAGVAPVHKQALPSFRLM